MALRRRVLVAFVVVAAVLVVTNVVLATTFHRFLLDRVDRQLEYVASRDVFQRDRGGRPPSPPANGALTEYFIAFGEPSSGTLYEYTSAFGDRRPPPRITLAELQEHATSPGDEVLPYTVDAQRDGGSWRLAAFTNRLGRVTVVGISLDELDATLDRVRLVQVASTVAVLAALAVVSWWMLRLGVHPLAAMARTADDIAAGDLSHRVEHPDPRTEAGRLGVALNAMLARIEGAFRAREASEARVRRFAADASHELRTPLTSIRGYAELWRAGGLRGDAELADAMRRIEQEAARMGALVEDLLVLARIDQGRPLELAPVRLDEIAGDAVRDARAVEPDRPIGVQLEAVEVQADELQLRQIAANLLANVRVHTPPGTPADVVVRAVDGVARLEVADRGPGMPSEVAERVFERFYRADASRARTVGGSGLGLAIVAAVAEAHGGRASVDTTRGGGSRFVVELPLQPADLGERGGLRG